MHEVLSDAQYSKIINSVNKGYWTRRRIQEYQSDIYESLKNRGFSDDQVRRIINLLKRYPPATMSTVGSSYMAEKKDPVTESIRVIKDID